jgi:hypothetical protein
MTWLGGSEGTVMICAASPEIIYLVLPVTVRRTCGSDLAGSVSGRHVTLGHELKLDLTLCIHFAPVSKSAVPRSRGCATL